MQKLFFQVKHNEAVTCAEHFLLFSEFHDVKTETCMNYKELFDKQYPFVQYKKSRNTSF